MKSLVIDDGKRGRHLPPGQILLKVSLCCFRRGYVCDTELSRVQQHQTAKAWGVQDRRPCNYLVTY